MYNSSSSSWKLEEGYTSPFESYFNIILTVGYGVGLFYYCLVIQNPPAINAGPGVAIIPGPPAIDAGPDVAIIPGPPVLDDIEDDPAAANNEVLLVDADHVAAINPGPPVIDIDVDLEEDHEEDSDAEIGSEHL